MRFGGSWIAIPNDVFIGVAPRQWRGLFLSLRRVKRLLDTLLAVADLLAVLLFLEDISAWILADL